MKWREIGPMRAGRTRALAGVPSEPATFYLGAVNGGVWKTTDAGATWHSVWDNEPTGSIGSIAVSESDPKVVYVADGEGLQRPDLSTGDGVYKSTDAGKTWTHLEGLRDGQQIGQIAIDPKNPSRVFVAVTGHPYGPNEERGFTARLTAARPSSACCLRIIAPARLRCRSIRSTPTLSSRACGSGRKLLERTERLLARMAASAAPPIAAILWTKLTGGGLPDDILQVQLTISPSDSRRIYAAVATTHATVGLYRSDDWGVNWIHAPVNDPRPEARIGGGDVPVPKVDPKDPNTVYVASVVTWKSTDAGKTWYGLRGAPGGDDYQNVFVNPNNTKIIALASDQGVIISQNGGETWTQWFNQAMAQVYHVTADNAFPYRVCGGQQDSGSACVDSRSNDGRITFHDWHPAGIEEYGYAAPDPLDPDIVYGGKVSRYDRRTGQTQSVEPKPLRSYRVLRTQPLHPLQAQTMVSFGPLPMRARILNRGKKIAILAGQGALHATEIEEVAEVLGAPIVKALLGKAAVPDDSPYTTGGIRLLGTEPSQDAIEGCDTLFMIGPSFPYVEFLPEPGSVKCVPDRYRSAAHQSAPSGRRSAGWRHEDMSSCNSCHCSTCPLFPILLW
jgi:hypothetical protein